jgi:hypothetical protein
VADRMVGVVKTVRVQKVKRVKIEKIGALRKKKIRLCSRICG